MIDPTNLILIILSVLSVIFTLFLCIIAIAAILGWQNLEAIKRQQRMYLDKIKKVLADAKNDVNLNKKDAERLINELREKKKQAVTSKDFKGYEIKTEELIERLNRAIRRAEDRVGDLKVSGFSSTTSIFPSAFPGNSESKICPYCGHLNYAIGASGLSTCANCGMAYY